MSTPAPVKCPRCGLNDEIRKVSTVVNQGTASASTPYRNVVSHTDLATRLRQPAPPAAAKSPELGCGCLGAAAIAVLLLFILGIAKVGVKPVSTGVPNYIVPAIIAVVVSLIGWIVWALIAKAREANLDRLIQSTAVPQWQARIRVWEDLYYCFRDDVVFRGSNPSQCVPSNDMAGLLAAGDG